GSSPGVVPFAGSWRQMMDLDGYSEFIGEALQFKFPQSHARAVRSAAIGSDDQAARERIATTADVLPPSADRLNREGRRVVVDPDVDPARVSGQIINSIRHGATELLDQEIVHAHFFRIALFAPLAAGVLEIADQLLLLGIDGYSRLVLGHGCLDRVVDHTKLRVAVGIVSALARLAIGLQAELLLLQQLADNRMAELVPEFVEFSRQPAQALARPAQRRHRIAARVGLDQRVQIIEQTGVRFRQRFASPSRTANATELQRRQRIEFLQAASDRARGDARDPGNRGYAAMPCRPGFRRSEKPSLPFIQLRQYRCIALLELLERIFINHPQNYDAPRPRGIPATSLSAQNRFSYCLTSPKDDYDGTWRSPRRLNPARLASGNLTAGALPLGEFGIVCTMPDYTLVGQVVVDVSDPKFDFPPNCNVRRRDLQWPLNVDSRRPLKRANRGHSPAA